MAWPDDDLQPVAPRSELLARVERRGREIRDRRRAALGVAAVVALLAVSVPTALLRDGGRGRRAVEVATSGEDFTTTESPATTTGPAPDPPTSTTSVLGGPLRTTVKPLPVRPSTTALPRPSTTAAPASPAPAPGAGPATTTTTEPAPLQPRCGPAAVDVTVTPEKPAFGPGETVRVTSTARNRTAQPCYYFSFTAGSTFKDSAGKWMAGMTTHADAFADVALAPGETLSSQSEWDQSDCTAGPWACAPAARGDYLITVSWSFDSPALEVTAPFRLVP